MLTLTFAGDESGDTSFSFGKGASRTFVYALIATQTPDALRQVLLDLRQQSNLPESYEFKFHSLTSSRFRNQVFTALVKAEFEAWAIVIDKTILSDPFKVMSSQDLYLYFVSELINNIPLEQREGAQLILDEYGSGKSLVSGFRRILKVRGIQKGFKQIVAKRSSSEPLIQVADLMAGAVSHRDSSQDSEAYTIIEEKINQVFVYCP